MPETITTPEGIAFRPNLLACTWHDGSLATTYERVVANVVCDNTVARVPQQAHPAADRLSAQRSIAAAGIVYSVARTYCHGVLRDLDRLRWAAARVQDDLRRTTGRLWSCVVGDDYVMSVTEGRRVEQVLLEAEVEEEEWFLPSGLEASELDGSLDADADEVVGGDTAQVLRVMGIWWPVCGARRRPRSVQRLVALRQREAARRCRRWPPRVAGRPVRAALLTPDHGPGRPPCGYRRLDARFRSGQAGARCPAGGSHVGCPPRDWSGSTLACVSPGHRDEEWLQRGVTGSR